MLHARGRAELRAGRAAPRHRGRRRGRVRGPQRAGFRGGAFVYVPRGVVADRADPRSPPCRRAAGPCSHRRTLIVLEEGAQAEVWEQYLSAADDLDGVFNTVVELVVGDAARLRYVVRPGPVRAELDLRHPARRGRPRRLAGLGRAGLRLGKRPRADGDPAGRRGRATHGHGRVRQPRPPAHRLRHHPGARGRRTRPPTSPSAGSSRAARPRSGRATSSSTRARRRPTRSRSPATC